jgi:hypothetical protein
MKRPRHTGNGQWKSPFKKSVAALALLSSLLLPVMCSAQRVSDRATVIRTSGILPVMQIAVDSIGGDRYRLTAINNGFANSRPAFQTETGSCAGSSVTHSDAGGSTALLGGGYPSPGPVLALTMADFTGDSHPDLATVGLDGLDSVSGHYSIEIRLTEGGHQSLRLTAPFGRLLITPIDVTGDGNLDLVIRTAWSQVPVAVFLNDGHGHFSSAKRPDDFPRALQTVSSEFVFTTEHQRFVPTLAFSESHTAERDSGWLHSLPVENRQRFSADNLAPWDSFLHFGSNRAPPTVI